MSLVALQEELDRCVRCGNCMAVCPVYKAMRHEGNVARGKLGLIAAHQRGELPFAKRYRSVLTACLLCNRCKMSCPNEVDTARVVQAARAELAEQKRSGWFKRFVLRRLLPARRFLPRLIAGARASRALWAARVPGDSGLHIRFLRGPGGERRRIPALAKRPYLARDPGPVADAAAPGPRVALFIGCVNNYLRPEAADAALALLQSAGAQVTIPRDQACCGMPAFGAGENEGARRLAARNLEAFLPAGQPWPEVITSPCASCAYMLSHHLPELFGADHPLAGRVRQLAERVVPLSVLWARLAGVSGEGPGRGAQAGRVTVTYHDPCHLSRGFGEKDAPRRLITSLPGASLVEMSHPCSCCGHGGSFNLAHYDLSSAMGQAKAEHVRETGAQVVITECSGCVLHLAENLGRTCPEVEVLTTAEAALRFGLATAPPDADEQKADGD